MATYFLVLSLVPLLGSFITEPAAMTLGALLLPLAMAVLAMAITPKL